MSSRVCYGAKCDVGQELVLGENALWLVAMWLEWQLLWRCGRDGRGSAINRGRSFSNRTKI
jgi:hypothetical protein